MNYCSALGFEDMMSADTNSGIHRRTVPSSFRNHHMVSFQSGAAGGSARKIPSGMDGFVGLNSPAGIIFTENPGGLNDNSLLIPGRNDATSVQLDPAMVLKYSAGLAVDWSFEEDALLEEGLVKYANEPSIMRYIKIASILPNKTVRDVALRRRWLLKKESGKRLKQEDYCLLKKMKDKKEKQVDSSSITNAVSSQPQNPVIPIVFHSDSMDRRNGISCEVPILDNVTQHLLEDNTQALSQIIINLDMSKLHDNVDLFFHVKNNVTSILKRMNEMPGIMSRMPPLPIAINEDLYNIILPGAANVTDQALIFGMSRGAHLRQEQEPRY